jgi:hypothetical protein
MKLWKIKKRSEKINLVEKNVGTPAILGRAPIIPWNTLSRDHVPHTPECHRCPSLG